MVGESPAVATASSAAPKRGALKKRGSYNCGRCGLPKKGHICPSGNGDILPPRSDHRLRRALSFEEDRTPSAVAAAPGMEEEEVAETPAAADYEEVEVGGGVLPVSCLVEVLRRLSPKELMGAAVVCRGWRECVKRVWRSAEELRLRVSPRSQIGFVGSVLHKCAGLARLTLRIESDVDATLLACVAFSCPSLEAFEINIGDNAVNRITGDELGRFVAEKRCLSVLKVEGCTSLGLLNLHSSSLSTLWLSDLYCISKMVISCPNLKELSLDFTRQENDSTDLVTMMDSLGRTCPRLRNMHIASIQLCNDAVLALASTNLRGLRMLSLVLGSKITDAAVAAIVSNYSSLELIDLSGSSISDSGIGMICNAFSQTLSRLLLALCPNITSSGIQFATAQLPLLQLIDCGMSMRAINSQNESPEENGLIGNEGSGELRRCQKSPTSKPQPIYQKLIIKHGCLRRISLWGCSDLDALYLNCPELNDLNLNSCANLHPERLLLQCPKLEHVHASGCQDMLTGAIRNQVLNEFAVVQNHLPCKRLADGSKRVQVPRYPLQQIDPVQAVTICL
ncbi:F-box/LRR-repeat protein 17-like isoform X2 [Phoenix dactylifera]|uniref:F-box/LRR-repeat protein 17-like isoform X2 n=1 Tax=Phoenix dactylifera TaxID=42345 RepID=A0A8B7MTT8_PHODC|nr:F-box/LRR-repeat protein 17-like isoform X2 [Phoenix dactylifera]